MLIKDIKQGYEKTIFETHIQIIDCEKSNNPDYPYAFTIWTDTFCTKFKTKKQIVTDQVVEAIEVYTLFNKQVYEHNEYLRTVPLMK